MNDKIIELLNSKKNMTMRNTYLILSFILMLGAVNVSAQQYGTTYHPSHSQTAVGNGVYGQPQSVYNGPSSSFSSTSAMPTTASSWNKSPITFVGASAVPQLATTTSNHVGRPRKIIGGGDEDENDEGEGGSQTGGDNGKAENQDDPYATPIGDAMIPLALLACAYVLARAFRRERA